MYYVMQRDSSASSQFIRFREIEPEDDGEQWLTGRAFETPPAGVVLSSKNEGQLPFSEFALTDIDMHIYSPKLRATIQALGVPNIQYCPVVLRDSGRGVQRDDYQIANYLDPIDCIDHDRSKFERSKKGRMLRLNQFALIEDRIQAAATGQAKRLLFRLAEYRHLVVAHESVKAACESLGMSGMLFTPTADYT